MIPKCYTDYNIVIIENLKASQSETNSTEIIGFGSPL